MSVLDAAAPAAGGYAANGAAGYDAAKPAYGKSKPYY